MNDDAALAHGDDTHDVERVSALVVAGAHCLLCIARRAAIPVHRVTAAFRRIESDWREQLIDTAECLACRRITTVYLLRVP